MSVGGELESDVRLAAIAQELPLLHIEARGSQGTLDADSERQKIDLLWPRASLLPANHPQSLLNREQPAHRW